MNKQTEWEKLLQEQTAGGTAAAKSTPSTQTGVNAQTSVDMNKQTINPGSITQSYYTNPLTYKNYESQQRPVYQQSQAVIDAGNRLTQHEQNKPGEYQSLYNDQIQGLIDSILNREKFHYDFAADPMYQQYAQQYQRGGQMAMKDAMAESAALTGGYGNSYAQQVGQQTYQRYMEDLNNIIPELRDAAYNMYVNEGNTMRDNLGMLQTEDDRDYGKYRDTVTDWQNELNYFYNVFSDMSDAEYQRYANDSAAWEADRAYWYQKAYDEQQQRNWEAQFNAMYGDGGSGGGGGGGGSKSSSISLSSTTQAGAAKELANLVNQGKVKAGSATYNKLLDEVNKKINVKPTQGNQAAKGSSGYTK